MRRALQLTAIFVLLLAPVAHAQVVVIMREGLTLRDDLKLPAVGLVNVLAAGPSSAAAGAATLGAGARATGNGDEAGLGYPVHLGLLGDAARAAGSCATAIGSLARIVTGPGASSSPNCGLVVISSPTSIRQWAGRAALLMVVSPWPGELNLAPVWISGLGRGLLFSDSTRTAGVATLADLTATIVQALGAPPTAGDLGRPLHVVPGNVAQLTSLFAEVRAARARRDPLIIAGSLIVLAAWILRGRVALLAATAVPLAYLGLAATPRAGIPLALLVFFMGVAALAGLGELLERRHGGHGFGSVGLATAIAVATDLVRGGPWMLASPLGFSYVDGARYYGLGNEYAGVLLGAGLVAAGLLLPRHAFPVVGVCVVALTGLPSLGANYGCLLGAVAGWGVACRVRLRWIALAAILAVAIALAADRGPMASHLAFNVARVSLAGAVGLARRKVAMNLGFLRTRAYAWLPLAALVAYGAAVARGPRDRLGAALQGLAVGAAADLLLNDSGVVAAATAVLYGVSVLLAGRIARAPSRTIRVAK